jgi:RNA polymerase sigma factor (sigma-70 family)
MCQEDRDDCAQRVFLKLIDRDYAALRAWRGNSTLSAYIIVITRNVAKDWLDSEGRKRKGEVPLDPESDGGRKDARGRRTRTRSSQASGDPDEDARELPPWDVIRDVASSCLTPRQCEILERYRQGEPAAQTAQALNMTRNHVYVERNRVMRLLRECLKGRGLWPQ